MIKITLQMRRMVRDVEYAKVVAQMVAAEDAMREYEARRRGMRAPYIEATPKLVKGSNQKPPTY
jgi:hypothetical protein